MKRKHAKIWDKIAGKYSKDKITSKVHAEHGKILRKYLTKGSVLDVGCAVGKHCLHLAKRGFDVTGLDISPKMISHSKSLFRKNKVKGRFTVGSATRLKFPDNNFENVICFGNSIGSIPMQGNRKKALLEMIRVSKKIVILELLKSKNTKQILTKYWFSGNDEKFPVKMWNEKEIYRLVKEVAKKINMPLKMKIIKGRKSVVEDYLFYCIIQKNF